MPLSTAPLERAGIHVTVEHLEALLQAAIEAALPPYGPVDARQTLPATELAFFREAGVDPEELAPYSGLAAPELRTAVVTAGLLATALTGQQAASRLGVDASRIRQRLADHSLYGIRIGGGWRLPQFQFTDDGRGVVPGFGELAPALAGLYPIDVATWFTTPHVDLVVGDEAHVSPRDWLQGGGDVRTLLPLVGELRGVA